MVRVSNHTGGSVSIHAFQKYLASFFKAEGNIFYILELEHWVREFGVCECFNWIR